MIFVNVSPRIYEFNGCIFILSVQSYDKQTFHSGTPPPFTMPGSGTTSSNLGNVSNVSAATGYAPQLYIPNAPAVAAGAHQQHHMHPNAHHQVCLNCVGCYWGICVGIGNHVGTSSDKYSFV